ncbi:hypothetical protein LX16_3349 [Stackebrandtia albiflava]|uniref:O-antigen ligase-like membrane protein n=2 Tax=Stackebrandtia albiflava TaxID=406432 RepID=A0A562V433_9ACTN|nr:hypothetical protein LX16_3349 [Stackebrandtia albiflava]
MRPVPGGAPAGSAATLLTGPGSLLTWLIVFYPVWWALGLGALIFPIVAIPMAVSLWRRRHVEVPPGFAVWLVFCLLVLLSLSALDVDPAGTVAEGWWGRLPGALYRATGYGCVTVIALYAVNLSEREFPRRRMVNLLCWLAVVTVAGGLLGTFAGHLEFTSPVEALLPPKVARDGFVQSLVHPQAAQVMDFLGYETPRPAAPWGYTNTWGNVLAVCVGWVVVAAFCFPVRWRWRIAAVALLAVAIVPVIQSMNRGLWFNLAVGAVVVAIRLAVIGQLWTIGVLALAGVLAVGVIVTTPLGEVVRARLDNGHSDDGRGFATAEAVEAVGESPVLGFGSTRKTIGSGESIAVGPTPECPRCGGRTLGGNGQLWQVLFAHGIAGTVAYLGFFATVLWRFRRDHTAVGIVGSVVMVLSLTSMFYYNALVAPLVITMLVYALMWRNVRDRAMEGKAR